jgi:hypothetical protein
VHGRHGGPAPGPAREPELCCEPLFGILPVPILVKEIR